MILLEGKKALITGGTSGIGKAIAALFAEHGADIMIFGTDEQKAKIAIEEIRKRAKNLSLQHIESNLVNVANYKEVEKACQSLLEEWGTVDILVNNAGITRDNLLLRMEEKEWDDVISVNLKSVYNTCKILTRSMIRTKKGKIINISSIAGLTGNAGQVNYAASKSGMIGFTKSLAKELARKNICVNCIAPGYIITPMTEILSEEVKQKMLQMIPMQRFGEPNDVAKTALFLASHLSDYITGQVLVVDGGFVI